MMKVAQANLICLSLSAGYYNLPGSADYAVTYGDVVLVERTMPVAQFGIAVPLAHDLFIGTALPEIYLNIQTGNIQSIRLQK